jgi:hypothetical protein
MLPTAQGITTSSRLGRQWIFGQRGWENLPSPILARVVPFWYNPTEPVLPHEMNACLNNRRSSKETSRRLRFYICERPFSPKQQAVVCETGGTEVPISGPVACKSS